MNKPPPKPPVGFQEALRRIAKTPKDVADKVANHNRDAYNESEAGKTPPQPTKRK
jgi:hypothetical protein